QPAQVEGAAGLVDVVGAQVELVDEELADLGRHAPVDLQADGLAEATAAQVEVDGGQQVVGLTLLQVEVGVSGDPEGGLGLHLHAREQLDQVSGVDLLQGHEALAVGQGHEAREQGENLDTCEAAPAG